MLHRLHFLAPLVYVTAVNASLIGCQQSDSGLPSAPDSGEITPISSSTNCGGEAFVSAVAEMYVALAPPDAGGGTIANGTYTLTTASIYTGVGGATGATGVAYEETMAFDNEVYTDLQLTIENDAGEGAPLGSSGVFATAGTMLSLTTDCPSAGAVFSFPYTVTGTALHVLVSANEEYVFTTK